MLGVGPTIKEVIGKFIETAKRKKNCKVHVKKSATLLNIYYFTSIFQGISPGFKAGFISTYERNTFEN